MVGSKALNGKVAVVTGASSGLGRATAIAMAAAGARVALLARAAADLDAVLEVIRRAEGPEAVAVPVDLADADAVVRAVEEVRQRLGPVDVLVNAAGTDVPGSIEELDVAGWDRVLDVNLRAVFLLSRAVFPDMRNRGGGTIVVVGSVAGRRGWANASAYCASKFALTGLTQAVAAEGREHGIRACLLYPGGMDTHWGTWSSDDRAATTKEVPAAEALPPDHVAGLITWIAASPPEMVLNEVTVTPILEAGWP